MYQYLFILLLSLSILFAPSVTHAQTPIQSGQTPTCTIIYGGGEIECEDTASITTKPTTTPKAEQEQSTPQSEQTTKGGLPVYESTNPAETPATGPETLALIGLIPAAAVGFYLRRKTK